MPQQDNSEDDDEMKGKSDVVAVESPKIGEGESSVKDDDDDDKKRKRSDSESSSSSSSSDSDDDVTEATNVDDGGGGGAKEEAENGDGVEKASQQKDDDDEGTTALTNGAPVVDGGGDELATKKTTDDGAATEMSSDDNAKVDESAEKTTDAATAAEAAPKAEVETIDLDKEVDPKDAEPGLRALHRTSSIFLRNLAPTITKAEVEAMCKRFNGFLRVAIADPLVERRWFRRGWVTFQRDVNIKEFCWSLNNIRLRDCELGAIVNRDLSRRVRPINGITAHKQIVRSDIKLCAKIAFNLDLKAGLWQNVTTAGDQQQPSTKQTDNGGGSNGASFGLDSANPVLQNITDYLIEEASAEEDELLGLAATETKDADGEVLDRDPVLISVLDKLILYLRIVHSVDFYNHCEYPYEDEMPNRCGIIHARGPAPQNKVNPTEVQEYTRNFEGKMSSFLAKSQAIEVGELKSLGCKDTEAEVEKFVLANTQELAKDKWLCPLSGKKFKGPDFIRKHIFNKHAEKVDEVRKEVEYFNNYLKDPKRPQLPEHPGNTRKPSAMDTGAGGGAG